jgi:hypothetical protein
VLQLNPNSVYNIGAAGFWLDRLKPQPRKATPRTMAERQTDFGRQIAAYQAEKRRITRVNDQVSSYR